jgi:hypothetical protein
MKINLEVEEAHLEIIKSALDLYLRIGIGQLEEAIHLYKTKVGGTGGAWDIIDSHEFETVKLALTGYQRNASASIANPNVKQDFKEAYTMLKLIERFMWEQNPQREIYSKMQDGNILQLNELPEIKLEVKKEN